jgi:PAS domain S-box-containing protein
MDVRTRISSTLTPGLIVQVVIAAAILIVLYLISLQNYLLFHSIVELAGIAVAFSIFILVWNTRKAITNTFFLIVGISFLFIGILDLFHTLAYKGMGVFPWATADLPTQLWIAARYFQCITFLIATLFIGRSLTRDRRYDTGIIFAGCAAACGLLVASIFVWHNFPPCFIEGIGLTPFKITSEYIISVILIAAGVVLYYKRHFFERDVWQFLIAALVFLILGELAFTSYISVFGFMNMLGHLFRLVSVYLFYRAFVVVGLTRPFDLLFRELRQKNEALQASEKRFHTMADRTYDWEYWIDQERRFVYISPSVEHITGYPTQDFIADPGLADRIVHPDDRALWDSHILLHQTGHKQDEPVEIEFRIIHRDGSQRWIAHVCRSIFSDAGVFAGTRVSNRDITDRKRVEEALALASKKLNLLSSITRHDILNQLMVLHGYLEMDLEDTSEPGLRAHIEHEIIAAKTIQHQIEFTREYQELGMKAPVWQNIRESLLQAAANLPIGPVRVSVDRSDVEVYADQLFGKVFYNLLDNALRYGGEKMTTIQVSSHEDDDSLVIIFEDNGAGIPAEDKNKLFKKGFGKNTGLGLFLSREILSITGITITENGIPGKGARFEIRVPKGMYRFGTV